MTSVLITATLAGIGYSLWYRRDTWWSRWEAAATLALALEGCALLLLSPWGAAEIGPQLHRATGLWNVQELIGHLCILCAIIANIYHVLVRLADPDQVRVIMRRHITVPIALTETVAATLFVIADADYHRDMFAMTATSAWLTGYELLGCGMVFYLCAYISRVLLALRGDKRGKTTVALYLASMTFVATACAILVGALALGVEAGDQIWACVCASVAVLAFGTTKSWRDKAAWFTAKPQRVNG